GESLRPGQWVALGVALVGVLYLTFGYGSFPWIGLSLAFSFAAYALFKKKSPFDALDSLSLEIGLVWLPALGFLAWLAARGEGHFGQPPLPTNLLLLGTGLITAVPLLLFGNAAKRIPLAYIGLLQYINPTLQFTIGTLVYGEAFSPQRALGYGLVWSALLVFSLEGIWTSRRARRLAAIS
ncbi:MAG: EamA family transporter RarD, partial [Anaerolineales bacterium]|nr:EamA family transporter RarD [Anaerolineales bacterium]